MRLSKHFQLPLFLALTINFTQIHAETAWDIVGIYPGMSPGEAEAQAKKIWPGIRLRPLEKGLTYSDGFQLRATEPTTVIMTGTSPKLPKENVGLTFTPGTMPPRLVSVSREVQPQNPPSIDQLQSALIEKYGQPYHRIESPGRGGNFPPSVRLFWAEPDKPRCDSNGYNDEPQAITASYAIEALANFRNLQSKGLAPEDLSHCGKQVVAWLKGNPVTTLNVQLTDTGRWLNGLERAESLIKNLEIEATKERESSAKNPVL